jgi:hypothetical protein
VTVCGNVKDGRKVCGGDATLAVNYQVIPFIHPFFGRLSLLIDPLEKTIHNLHHLQVAPMKRRETSHASEGIQGATFLGFSINTVHKMR